jgi:hypothetical protein
MNRVPLPVNNVSLSLDRKALPLKSGRLFVDKMPLPLEKKRRSTSIRCASVTGKGPSASLLPAPVK